MNKDCPNCGDRTIPVKGVLFSDYTCPNCKRMVGIHWAASALFSILIFVVTLITTFIIYVQFDIFAAVIWFTLPIGALSYVKARFFPLQQKNR